MDYEARVAELTQKRDDIDKELAQIKKDWRAAMKQAFQKPLSEKAKFRKAEREQAKFDKRLAGNAS